MKVKQKLYAVRLSGQWWGFMASVLEQYKDKPESHNAQDLRDEIIEQVQSESAKRRRRGA